MPPTFKFARSTRLGAVFPQAAASEYINPTEVDGRVVLIHPAVNPAEACQGFRAFTFAGAAGLTTVALSPTPPNLVQYYYAFDLIHNDPVSRDVFILMREELTGITVGLCSTRIEGPIPPNTAFALTRPVAVPEGFELVGACPALAAGQVLTLRGIVRILDRGEPAPPLF